ncbi:hypothetical protein LINGRAHAP2_LOCUS34361 [Linum grandiflorum]
MSMCGGGGGLIHFPTSIGSSGRHLEPLVRISAGV